jgi:hypothetical protein
VQASIQYFTIAPFHAGVGHHDLQVISGLLVAAIGAFLGRLALLGTRNFIRGEWPSV